VKKACQVALDLKDLLGEDENKQQALKEVLGVS